MFRAYLLSDGQGAGMEALLGWMACEMLSSGGLDAAQRMTDTDFLPQADSEGPRDDSILVLNEGEAASKARLPSGSERDFEKVALATEALVCRSLSNNGGGTASRYLLLNVLSKVSNERPLAIEAPSCGALSVEREAASTDLPPPCNARIAFAEPLATAPLSCKALSLDRGTAFNDLLSIEAFIASEELLAIDALPSEALSIKGLSTEALSICDISIEVLSIKDFPSEALLIKDLSTEALSTKDLSTEDLSIKDLPIKSLSMKDLSTECLSIKGFPIESLSIKDLSIKDLSINGLLIEALSVEDLPIKDTSIEVLSSEALYLESSSKAFSRAALSIGALSDFFSDALSIKALNIEALSSEAMSIEAFSIESSIEAMSSEAFFIESSIKAFSSGVLFIEPLPIKDTSSEALFIRDISLKAISITAFSNGGLSLEGPAIEDLWPVQYPWMPQRLTFNLTFDGLLLTLIFDEWLESIHALFTCDTIEKVNFLRKKIAL